MKNKPGVIVVGGHVQALGIIRVFGSKNIKCMWEQTICWAFPTNLEKK